MRKGLNLFVQWLGGAMVTLVLLFGYQALADGSLKTDQVAKLVPYKGTLEKDGNPFNGNIEMRFDLYDGAGSSSSVWNETLMVQVHNGAFSVMLGSSSAASVTNLTQVLTSADDVYLSIALDPAGANVALTNKQRFLPVPYAMWSTSSTDFTVGNSVVIESDLAASASNGPLVITDGAATLVADSANVNSDTALTLNGISNQPVNTGGALSVGTTLGTGGDITGGGAISSTTGISSGTTLAAGTTLSTGGAISSGGDLSLSGSQLIYTQFTGQGDGGVALRHGSNDRLVVNSSGQLGNLTHVQSNLEVDGSAQFDSTVSFGQNVSGLNVTLNTNDCETIDASSISGSGQASFYCSGNRVLRGLKVQDKSGDGTSSTLVVDMYCCSLTVQ